MSASEPINTITLNTSMLQGILPVTFQVNLTELIIQEQQVLLVNQESLRSKYLVNGNTIVLDMFTSSNLINNLITRPQFIYLDKTILEPNWNNKYQEKIYASTIDAKVSISVVSVLIFLLLLYHLIVYIKKLRLPKYK